MKNTWINPDTYLPEIGKSVLMYMGNDIYKFGCLESITDYGDYGGKHNYWKQDDTGWGSSSQKPIAWQYLEPPYFPFEVV